MDETGASLLTASCPLPITDYKEIVLAHGSGGKLSHQLISKMVAPQFANELLAPLHDGAIFSFGKARLAFSTDSYVVSPIFFPGGDIGRLAVHGTVNDLAMCGAKPALSLRRFHSRGRNADGRLLADRAIDARGGRRSRRAAWSRATPKSSTVARRIRFSSTPPGIGVVPEGVNINRLRARPGDKVIISGSDRDPRHRHHVGSGRPGV